MGGKALSITWLGHSTFLFQSPGGKRILIEPWVASNPSCPESAKKIGGKKAVAVPFFPANALLITSLDNLSIYAQEGTRRRQIKDEPALDQIEDYQSVNEAYVVEDYGRSALVENIVMGPAPARAVAP